MADTRFDRAAIQAWRRAVYREFKTCGFKNGTRQMAAAVVLAAVAEFGTDSGVLAELTGQTEPFVAAVLKRLRKEGILRGQTLRIRWDKGDGFEQRVAVGLDAMTAAGEVARFKNPKAVARGKKAAAAPRRKPAAPKRRPVAVSPGAVFTPARKVANPLYGLPEWKTP